MNRSVNQSVVFTSTSTFIEIRASTWNNNHARPIRPWSLTDGLRDRKLKRNRKWIHSDDPINPIRSNPIRSIDQSKKKSEKKGEKCGQPFASRLSLIACARPCSLNSLGVTRAPSRQCARVLPLPEPRAFVATRWRWHAHCYRYYNGNYNHEDNDHEYCISLQEAVKSNNVHEELFSY